jgi:hypothetical protein
MPFGLLLLLALKIRCMSFLLKPFRLLYGE